MCANEGSSLYDVGESTGKSGNPDAYAATRDETGSNSVLRDFISCGRCLTGMMVCGRRERANEISSRHEICAHINIRYA